MRLTSCLLGTAATAAALAGAAAASETVTYSYDALGRLVAVATSGGPNDGVDVGTSYDPAGNRCHHVVAAGGGAQPCPAPPPPPPPPNQPPVTVADSGSQQRCSTGIYNVTANDSDPDGDLPLTVTAVSGPGYSVHSPSEVQFVSGNSTGPKTGTYTVQDTRGATADGTITVTVTGGTCQ